MSEWVKVMIASLAGGTVGGGLVGGIAVWLTARHDRREDEALARRIGRSLGRRRKATIARPGTFSRLLKDHVDVRYRLWQRGPESEWSAYGGYGGLYEIRENAEAERERLLTKRPDREFRVTRETTHTTIEFDAEVFPGLAVSGGGSHMSKTRHDGEKGTG